MSRAGLRDREITIQSRTLATNGDPTAFTWTDLATVWAEKVDSSGIDRVQSEQFAGQQIAATAVQAFRIQYRTDVDPTMRVVDEDGAVWNIIATPEGKGRRTETVLLVYRIAPNETS